MINYSVKEKISFYQDKLKSKTLTPGQRKFCSARLSNLKKELNGTNIIKQNPKPDMPSWWDKYLESIN